MLRITIGSRILRRNRMSKFSLPVYGDDGNIERYNIFRGRLLIRHASGGKKYLYDILELKKETGKSCQT